MESPQQHEEHIRTSNRKERRLYNRPELGRIEESVEGIQSDNVRMKEYATKIRRLQGELGISVASFPNIGIQ